MNEITILENAFLTIKDGIIDDFGIMSSFDNSNYNDIFDAKQGIVLPCWNDSHTHLILQRAEKEFIDKINGLSYQEIAQRGGGILNSAKHLENINQNQLFEESYKNYLI